MAARKFDPTVAVVVRSGIKKRYGDGSPFTASEVASIYRVDVKDVMDLFQLALRLKQIRRVDPHSTGSGPDERYELPVPGPKPRPAPNPSNRELRVIGRKRRPRPEQCTRCFSTVYGDGKRNRSKHHPKEECDARLAERILKM